MSAEESPLDRVEQEIARLKAAPEHVVHGTREEPPGIWREVTVRLGLWAELEECDRLQLLNTLDWRGIDPAERYRIEAREIDHSKLPDDIFWPFRRRR